MQRFTNYHYPRILMSKTNFASVSDLLSQDYGFTTTSLSDGAGQADLLKSIRLQNRENYKNVIYNILTLQIRRNISSIQCTVLVFL